MRKIEFQMLAAIAKRIDWKNDNTEVFYISAAETGNPHGARSEVFLYGNHIADYWHNTDTLETDAKTLSIWPSKTTKSRLRALGANVTTKKGAIFLNEAAV
jgi:hypothetical protein